MIVVKLMGGLGNQMFQYAFGRYLSFKNKTELKLDLSYLSDKSLREDFTSRDFELHVLNINASVATPADILPFQNGMKRKILHYLTLYSPFSLKYLYLKEPHFTFFNQALKAPSNTYINGYWQSEQYFTTIREQLRKDFTPAKSLSPNSDRMAKEIKKNESVSIHVRRGDYVTNSSIKQHYFTCTQEYYYEAIKIVIEKVPNPKFYVFSDDPEWFKQNVRIDFPVEYVDFNVGSADHEDIYLMSLCKHNIIANSSFSWWGAWLNDHANKIVIAPQKWFKDPAKSTKDLLPSNWIKI